MNISAKDETCAPGPRYPIAMDAKYSLASTAALMADPGRSAMLTALMEGRALAAGELARAANVSAQSASMHLSQLLEGGLVKVAQDGRHRYYQIASPAVAHAVEALGVISSPRKQKPIGEPEGISYARTCYDHLAGALAVSLAESLQKRRFLVASADSDRDFALTRSGEQFFTHWDIDVSRLRSEKRNFARRCLDWTERRDHIAGSLGAAICQKFLELRWITRDRRSRVVRLTAAGRSQLESLIALPAAV
jgi:DNA-binding transcriptional ArsR family regulator